MSMMACSSQENISNGNLASQKKEEMVQVSLSFSKEQHLPKRVGKDLEDSWKFGTAFTMKIINLMINSHIKLHPFPPSQRTYT